MRLASRAPRSTTQQAPELRIRASARTDAPTNAARCRLRSSGRNAPRFAKGLPRMTMSDARHCRARLRRIYSTLIEAQRRKHRTRVVKAGRPCSRASRISRPAAQNFVTCRLAP